VNDLPMMQSSGRCSIARARTSWAAGCSTRAKSAGPKTRLSAHRYSCWLIRRAPWVRKGGTTFYFVTDGIERALEQARAAARGKDVRISGGADTIRQYFRAKLVDEITVHVGPLLLGRGLRLFDELGPAAQVDASGSPLVTHVRYRVSYSPWKADADSR
jgi:dihydrofolate reductase